LTISPDAIPRSPYAEGLALNQTQMATSKKKTIKRRNKSGVVKQEVAGCICLPEKKLVRNIFWE
jgi:hypothetical protein